jgi:hypothetical protein
VSDDTITMLTARLDALAGEIEVLAAEREIRRVLHDYCRAIDRFDWELFRSVWHPDATIDYEGWFTGNRDEAVDVFSRVHPGYVTHSHQVTSVKIAVDGERAVSEAYVTVRMRSYPDDTGRSVDIFVSGRYLDRWSRRDGRWAIDDRRYVNDVFSEYEVAGTFAGALPDRPDEPMGGARRGPDDPSYALFEPLLR